MNALKKILITGIISILAACGGGGSSSSKAAGSDSGGSNQTIVFEFDENISEPSVAWMGASDEATEHHFSPDQVISAWFDVKLRYSDNSLLSDTRKYQANIYLSDDEILDEATDLQMIDITCQIPTSSDYACGQYASFQCAYANDLSLTCNSIPLGKLNGINDNVVDATPFLNVIPKIGYAIFKICLIDDDDGSLSHCQEATDPIQLN